MNYIKCRRDFNYRYHRAGPTDKVAAGSTPEGERRS